MTPFTGTIPASDVPAYARSTDYLDQSPDHLYPLRMTSSRASISSAASSQSALQPHPSDVAHFTAQNQSHLQPPFTATAPTLTGPFGGDEASTRPNTSEQEPTQLFACPYTKADAHRYSAANLGELHYRGCGSCYLTDISRLKQHLYRVHERPQHFCPKCFQQFKTQDACDRHRAAASCREAPCPWEEKMTPEQLTIIKKKNRGLDPIDCWFDIFETLFPGTPHPPSPFATFTNLAPTASLDSFMQYIQERAPARFRQQICNNMMFNETTRAQISRSLEASLRAVLRDLRRDYEQSISTSRAPASSVASTGPIYDDDEQVQRPSRKRKTTDASLQVPTGPQYAVDTQSIGSYGEVSAPHSFTSTPALRDDESEPYTRPPVISPALRFVAHSEPRDSMHDSLDDQLIHMVSTDNQWHSALATASDPNAFYRLENPQTSSSPALYINDNEEWPTDMMTGANLTMGMGQPSYTANAHPRWMGKGGDRPW